MSKIKRKHVRRYLRSKRSTLWGRAFDLSQPESAREAMDFLYAAIMEVHEMAREDTKSIKGARATMTVLDEVVSHGTPPAPEGIDPEDWRVAHHAYRETLTSLMARDVLTAERVADLASYARRNGLAPAEPAKVLPLAVVGWPPVGMATLAAGNGPYSLEDWQVGHTHRRPEGQGSISYEDAIAVPETDPDGEEQPWVCLHPAECHAVCGFTGSCQRAEERGEG